MFRILALTLSLWWVAIPVCWAEVAAPIVLADGASIPGVPQSGQVGAEFSYPPVSGGGGTVAFDAESQGAFVNAASGPTSWTHTPIGTPSGVAVLFQGYNGSAWTVTYGGSSCTQTTSVTLNAPLVLYLFACTAPAAGPQTVQINWTGSAADVWPFAISVTGGSTTTLFSNFGSSAGTATTVSSSTTSASGELVVDIAGQNFNSTTLTPSAPQTQRGTNIVGANTIAGVSTQPGAAGTVTSTWTGVSGGSNGGDISASFKVGP